MHTIPSSSLPPESPPYGWGVCLYDASDFLWQAHRRLSVIRLNLQPGAMVLDLGCGTGLSFALFEQSIGPEGHILGIDSSAQMLARAQERCEKEGWQNVTLMRARAEEVTIPQESVDALYCFYVHDLLLSQPAMEQATNALRPGGNLAIAGPKQAAGWPGQMVASLFEQAFVADVSHTPRPWSVVEELVGPLQAQEALWGSTYVAWGSKS
jgi:ubiquinone/menaquinone biosynthesis C-methylase UbiE